MPNILMLMNKTERAQFLRMVQPPLSCMSDPTIAALASHLKAQDAAIQAIGQLAMMSHGSVAKCLNEAKGS